MNFIVGRKRLNFKKFTQKQSAKKPHANYIEKPSDVMRLDFNAKKRQFAAPIPTGGVKDTNNELNHRTKHLR